MRTTARTVILTLAMSLLLAMLALFFIFRFLLPTSAAQDVSSYPYTIGTWQGYVAVFEREDDYPMQIFDTAVATLPAEQRAHVERGIPVKHAEELYSILEDYTN